MSEPEIKNPVLQTLMQKRHSAEGSVDFYQNQVKYKAQLVKELRERFVVNLAEAQDALKRMEENVHQAVLEVEMWSAAIRTLRMERLAGEPDAITAIGEEEADGQHSEPKV